MKILSRVLTILLVLFLLSLASQAQEFRAGDLKLGKFTELPISIGTWRAPESTAAVIVPPNQSVHSLHYWGTKDQYLVLELGKMNVFGRILLDVERWTSAAPFEMSVEIRTAPKQWRQVFALDQKTPVGFGRVYLISTADPFDAIRFKINAKKDLGIMIHGIRFVPRGPMIFEKADLLQNTAEEPIVIASDQKDRPAKLQTVRINTRQIENPLSVENMTIRIKNAKLISRLEVRLNGRSLGILPKPIEGTNKLSFTESKTSGSEFKRSQVQTDLSGGADDLTLWARASESASVEKTISAQVDSITLSDRTVTFQEKPIEYLFGTMIRDLGWDGVNCYRIPGLARSNKGTLLAVYDIRHNNWRDLPEDIDIGCSRSFDGGKTWRPMQVIMNQRGADEKKEGVGDPTILVDRQTGRIWVAALWAHNGYSTEASLPGLKLGTSGQMVLIYSDDDGATWSKPVSITSQAAPGKNWRILFQGPGAGITMRDGTLVFPAQFIDSDRQWFSTIVWSRNHGKSWTAGTGARPGTCEAQIAELNDGSIMINMRNFQGRARSVAVTSDLGKTWTEHSSSLKALPEPICQASLLKLRSVKDGDSKDLLVFCNPNSTKSRTQMSLQFSEDEGKSWPKKILLNRNPGNGYSCLEQIDRNNLGILYETSGGLIFQRIPIR